MKNIIFIFFGIIFIIGCTKEGGNLYIEGRVYNPVTGEGIEGVTFTMYRTKPLSGIPSDSKDVARVTTDVNGYYKMSHFGGGLVYYVNIQSGTDGYYLLGWISDNDNVDGAKYQFTLPKGKNVTADYEMVPYGGLKLLLDNINCQNSEDEMRFRSKDFQSEGFGSWSSVRKGCYSYQTPEYFQTPMGWKVYEWEVTRNAVVTYYTDSVFLPENGQVLFELKY